MFSITFAGLGDLDRRGLEHARLDHRAVGRRHPVERHGVFARHDLGDALERVLLVARVDALGAVAQLEVDALLEPRYPGENRPADVFGDARVDGRLVDHHVALLQRPAHRL
ncbi:MAG: hypothetical protein IPJ65_39850 [Archangiaceae bacterium]|nr:hypothetical protein [Archangiaceae bacterium]